ncbi:MAG TPA: hypothetical protein VER12_16705 [Polyangiaceae bacterium]|nr:hypothetical protein [Polyangiaceae bacterium]
MNFPDDDDSVFEQALRADLPSLSEQNRLRPRLLAAGVAAGTALGSTNVAAAAQASFGASALSKLSALSWPAKLGLTAALAAPVAVLPLAYPPVAGADLVSHVRSSAAGVRARSAAIALHPVQLPMSEVSQSSRTTPSLPEPEARLPTTGTARASVPTSNTLPAQAPAAIAPNPGAAPAAAAPTSAAGPAALAPDKMGSGSAEPSVADFDALAQSPASEAPNARNASTLAAETQLLDRAFAALAAGDRRTAAASVAEHARLFPNGLLRQERERARARLATDSKGE